MLTATNLTRLGLSPLSFHMNGGEGLAVTGPSGSGKTLLLRALGDLDPSDGQVSLAGKDRHAMAGADWRKQVTYLSPTPGWWSSTVQDHFQAWDTMGVAAEAVSLPRNAGAWQVERLSTGESQRLALLRALEGRPSVLLLDEPTSALDEKTRDQVCDLLSAFKADGGIVVIVTHDPKVAEVLSDQRLVMDNGIGTLRDAPSTQDGDGP